MGRDSEENGGDRKKSAMMLANLQEEIGMDLGKSVFKICQGNNNGTAKEKEHLVGGPRGARRGVVLRCWIWAKVCKNVIHHRVVLTRWLRVRHSGNQSSQREPHGTKS